MAVQANPDLIFQILDFGITQDIDLINKALIETRNNMQQAIDYIIRNPGAGSQPPGDQRPEVETEFGTGRLQEETYTERIIDLEWGTLTKPKGVADRVGEIRWTKQRITKEMIGNTENVVYCFGDNDIDKYRVKGINREYIGGMASSCGPYDRSRAYGFVTTFYGSPKPNVADFQNIIDGHMNELAQILSCGIDIVVPQPNIADLDRSPKNYYLDEKQVINHNLGTGLAGLSMQHLLVIENGLQRLAEACKNGEIQPSLRDGDQLKQNENSEIAVPEEFARNLHKPVAKGLEPIVVGGVEFIEGMLALRKGKECRIQKIDRMIDPPSCTVLMLEAGNVVGTELQFLSLPGSDNNSGGGDEDVAITEEQTEAKKPAAQEKSSEEDYVMVSKPTEDEAEN